MDNGQNPDDPKPDAPGPGPEATPPARPGHPNKYTRAVGEQVAECLRLGLNYTQTCDALGLGLSTFRRWRKHKAELRAIIKKAEAQAVGERLAALRLAGIKSWQAAAWWLERKYPCDWGRIETVSIQARQKLAEGGGPAGEAQAEGHERQIRLALDLPKDAPREEVERALDAKRQRALDGIFGIVPPPGEVADPMQAIRRRLFGEAADTQAEPTKAERIQAIMSLQEQIRQLAGKDALDKGAAFEAAARELDPEPENPGK